MSDVFVAGFMCAHRSITACCRDMAAEPQSSDDSVRRILTDVYTYREVDAGFRKWGIQIYANC